MLLDGNDDVEKFDRARQCSTMLHLRLAICTIPAVDFETAAAHLQLHLVHTAI